jgi:hypothetical protein
VNNGGWDRDEAGRTLADFVEHLRKQEEEEADRKLHPYRRKYRKTPDLLYWRVAKRRAKAEYKAGKSYDPDLEAFLIGEIGRNPRRVGMLSTDWGSAEFNPFSPRARTKKELRNRIRWLRLRAEVTRIMTGKKYNEKVGNPRAGASGEAEADHSIP